MLPPVIYLMLHSLFFTLRLSGGGDSFPRQAEEREVDRYGAEKGYLDVVCLYADDIYGENRAEAFELYRRPAKLGEPQAFSVRACPMEGVERDVRQAGAYRETREKLRHYKKTFFGIYDKETGSVKISDSDEIVSEDGRPVVRQLQTATSDGKLLGLIPASEHDPSRAEDDNPVAVILY